MCSIQQHQVDVRSTSSCCGSCLPMHAAACLTNWRKHSDERSGQPTFITCRHVMGFKGSVIRGQKNLWLVHTLMIPSAFSVQICDNYSFIVFSIAYIYRLERWILRQKAKAMETRLASWKLTWELEYFTAILYALYADVFHRARRKREDVARRRVQSARWQARIAMHFLFFGKTLHVGPCCIQSLTIDLSC